MSEENKQLDIESAKKIIEDQYRKDVQDCLNELNDVKLNIIQPILEKYGCREMKQLQLVGDRIVVSDTIDKIR